MNINKKLETIREQLKFDFIKAAFIKTDFAEKHVKSVYALGNNSDRYMRIVLQKRIGLAGLVIKTGRPHYIVNVAKEISPENRLQYPIILAEGLKSLGAVPIFHNREVVGVVLAGFRTFDKMTEQIVEQFEEMVTNEFSTSFCKEGI